MNHESSSRFSATGLSLALSVALGVAALTPAPAHAYLASEITQIANKIQLGIQKAKLVQQLTELKQQVQTLTDTYNSLNIGNFNLKAAAGFREQKIEELQERGVNQDMDVLCQMGKTGVATEQYKICQRIVQVRNLRFNVMVKMLKDVEKRDKQVQDLVSNRDGITGSQDNGKVLTNTNQAGQLSAQMSADFQNGKYMLDAYTAVLEALNDDMIAQAEKALKNKKDKGDILGNIASTVVQGAALEAGLLLARQRDL
ncbi:hypothetical protein [Lysobacter sp. CA199]|uniref:hypothetical protein n=1 Tax=Lysobacter sp. CA199 TaxID=3455608 RepID=UPI003F8D687B